MHSSKELFEQRINRYSVSTCKSAFPMSGKANHVGVTTMERLDQDNLHPRLDGGPETDMPRPGNEPGPSRWEACTL